MKVHLLFIVLYVVAESVVGGAGICILMMLHCLIQLYGQIKAKRGLNLLMVYYGGVVITALADFSYISRINTVGNTEHYIYNYIVEQYIDAGMLMYAIGNTFIFIGFELFRKRSLPSIAIHLTSKKAVVRIYYATLLLVVMNLTGNAVSLGFISGAVQKLFILMGIMGSVFFARLWAKENKAIYFNYALVLTLIQTIAALYSSYLRTEVIAPTVSFFAGYFIGKGNVKYLMSWRLIPLGIAMLTFSLFFNTLAKSRSHFIDVFTSSGGDIEVGYTDLSEREKLDRGGILARLSNIAQLTNVVNLVEKNGHYGGRASAPLIAALVPRFLWPDKPRIQLGAWFALEIGVATIGPTGRANNSVNITIPGELYLDFGWIGLMLGGIAFGGILACFWNASHFNSSPYNLSGVLWGGYLMQSALFAFGSDLQLLVTFTSTYIMFLVLKRIHEGIVDRPVMARK